jgi:hypothetical protein
VFQNDIPKTLTLKRVRSTCRSSWPSSTLTWSGAVEESIADEDGIHAREVWQSMSSTCISPEFLRHHIDKEWDFRKLGKHNPDACIQVMDPHKPWDLRRNSLSGSQNVVDFAIRYPHQPFPTWKISFMATLKPCRLHNTIGIGPKCSPSGNRVTVSSPLVRPS